MGRAITSGAFSISFIKELKMVLVDLRTIAGRALK
jgi:hypothetical protein